MTGTIQERFEAKITKTRDCWNWKASKNNKGYGQFKIAGKYQKAHRVSWMLYMGEIPSGMCVLHHCDCPSCVNPSHLFLGTNADNVHDRNNKSRQADTSGEKNGKAKLAEGDVRTIRTRWSNGVCQTDIAREFGVTHQNISYIVRGIRWATV